MSRDELRITIPDGFVAGSADLKPDAARALARIAPVLVNDYPGTSIRVEGHTDSTPIRRSRRLWKDNWDLSTARARTVVRSLIGKGVPAKRLAAAGFGSTRPLASNRTAAGRAKNRRVEIVLRAD
jgi:chemotaxis protein MotB